MVRNSTRVRMKKRFVARSSRLPTREPTTLTMLPGSIAFSSDCSWSWPMPRPASQLVTSSTRLLNSFWYVGSSSANRVVAATSASVRPTSST